MENKQDLIKHCKFYRGEDVCPIDDLSSPMHWFWDMERVYVRNNGELFPMHEDYEMCGGKKYDDLHYPILIVMFTSWGKFTYCIEDAMDNFYELMEKYIRCAKEYNYKNKEQG